MDGVAEEDAMKGWLAAAWGLALGIAAAAQEDPQRKLEELRSGFEKSMKALREKFEAERERLEKEFRAAREKLERPGPEKKAPPRKDPGKEEPRKEGPRKEEPRKEGPRGLEPLVEKLLERVERLEKRLDRDLPGLKDRLERWKKEGAPWGREGGKLMPPGLRERLEQWKRHGGPGPREWEKWIPPALKEHLKRWRDGAPCWKGGPFGPDRDKKDGEKEKPGKDRPRKTDRKGDRDRDDNF